MSQTLQPGTVKVFQLLYPGTVKVIGGGYPVRLPVLMVRILTG